jgi:hypothetical protein
MAQEEKDNSTESIRAFYALLILMIIGLLAILIYALQAASAKQFTSFMSAGIVIAGAALFVGGLLGFLFGIPRTLEQSVPVKPAGTPEADAAANDSTGQANFQANTNLEQISDWLTKILVGVGLTQLTIIPGKLQGLAAYAANGLGATDASRTFALCLILLFLVCGFVFAYLWTRLYLPGEFVRADKALQLAKRAIKVAAEAKTTSVNAQANVIGIGKSDIAESGIMFAAAEEVTPGSVAGDPWKNQFGGASVNNNRQLRAEVKRMPNNPDLFSIRLTVSSMNAAKFPLQGVIQFFLHPTFKNERPVIPVGPNGVAELILTAWGAFTVGALADGGETKLELDLSELTDAPADFRNR